MKSKESRSLHIAGMLGEWCGRLFGIAVIMAGFAGLIWWNWPDLLMVSLVSFLAGYALHKMWVVKV